MAFLDMKLFIWLPLLPPPSLPLWLNASVELNFTKTLKDEQQVHEVVSGTFSLVLVEWIEL